MDDAVLRFERVAVRYADEPAFALSDCSFALRSGERVALLGPNGSGKTTILAAAVGLVPHTGEITVLGRRLDARSLDAVRASIGFLFSAPEDQLLFPRVLDDVAFSLVGRGVPEPDARARAKEMLDTLDAGHLAERSPYRLSRGQVIRAALAGTLVARPPLLLLDEPTSGLDPAGRRRLAATLAALPVAMLIATHEIDWAASLCTRYLLLDGGRIVDAGTDFGAVAL